MLRTRTLEADEFTKIVDFYSRNGYESPISPEDHFLIVEDQDEILGALRVCNEEGVLVLRGMLVADRLRGQGIGTQLLDYFSEYIEDQDCYCIAHRHLANFYGRVGFEELDTERGPDFLHARQHLYQTKLGMDVLLLHKLSNGDQVAR